MDEYNIVLNELKKYKTSHPNIIKMWETYLEVKYNNLKKSIDNTKDMLKKIDEIDKDIDAKTLLALFLLANS